MKVVSADFVTSASAGSAIPRDGLPSFDRQLRAALRGLEGPQVALAGRSNVGKSSLINALTRRKIARTSAAPGKTRLVNLYRIELEGVPRPGSGQAPRPGSGQAPRRGSGQAPRRGSGQAAGPGRIALYLVDLPGYGYARGGADAAAELKAVAEAYFSSYGGPGALLLVDSRHPGLDADIQAARWLGSVGVETRIVATKIDKLTRSERARNLKAIGDTFGTAAQPVSATSGEGLDELWRTIVTIARDADRDG